MTDVERRLKVHYKKVCEVYGEENILGVFLYGSWNYGTNLPDSDVDTKCILVPDLYHLAVSPYETKHLHIDDEICECMTIQHMIENWKKQNINFLEILYTPHCVINVKYLSEWLDFSTEWREAIAHYDIKKAILSMGHQALHTYKQDPTNFKKQMNTARIHLSLQKLVNNHNYWRCIHFEDTEKIMLQIIRAEGCPKMSMDFIIEDLNRMVDHAEEIANACLNKYATYSKIAITAACEDLILSLIRKNLIYSGDI